MPSHEEELVDRWKIEQLDRLGFDIADINALLIWRVDMHDVWRLMGSPERPTRCTHAQAMRILRPLDVRAPVVTEESLTPA
jgi:hypothetical protein